MYLHTACVFRVLNVCFEDVLTESITDSNNTFKMSLATLSDIFASKDFDPDKYVNEVGSQCVGGVELVSHKAKLQTLSDETHFALKKNVFQHYEQFIETAKDISYLAGEMYQISQMLRDQKSLVQNILDTSIIAKRPTPQVPITPTEPEVKAKIIADDNRKKLLTLLEKVEGAAEVIEHDHRVLIHEGDLLEIDPDSYSAVQRKRGYLFNDGIMLAQWVPNRRGPQRYKFEAFYELGAIGLVVNIRDPECPKCVFKLLIFPSVHLLQCPNQQEKDSWVNNIEGQQKILRNPAKSINKSASIDSPVTEVHPGFPSIDSERAKSPEDSSMVSFQPPLPEWILDIPEDLDVWIAQRNFTEAVNQYESFQEFVDAQHMSLSLKDIKAKVEARIKTLIDILVSDLEIMTPAKILQGGPRSIRKSVDLLVRLGRENQASQLFLAHRSAYIKQRLKQLKTEGRSQIYLDHMAVIFFSNIQETMKEYKRSFSEKICGVASLVVWVNGEVVSFVNSYCRLLFGPQAHLSTVSKSVANLRSESQQLNEFGMDISCTVDSILLSHIERTATDAKDKLIEAVKHRYRATDEIGTQMKFADKVSLSKMMEEMSQLGIDNMHDYRASEASLSIGSSTLAFAKSWLHFCEVVMQLIAPEWQLLIETAICEVLLTELKQLERTKKKMSNNSKILDIIERGACFILGPVCKAGGMVYRKAMGEDLQELQAIVEEFRHLRGGGYSRSGSPSKRAPVPLPRTLSGGSSGSSGTTTRTKFTSPEYV